MLLFGDLNLKGAKKYLLYFIKLHLTDKNKRLKLFCFNYIC